ncbi:hypothetical protein [Novosphingobium sp.]|uniref:hypothetical protein n=1 Tax=Novosphingobium sp. TaxID=1874826 RepID=UPI00286DD8CB|nr:hypothetical protein [Novosphingobium sp.]
MNTRKTIALFAACAVLLPLSACDRKAEAPAASPAKPKVVLDHAALSQVEDPARVLAYYGAALAAHDWEAADAAWGSFPETSPGTLRAYFGKYPALSFHFDPSRIEGAAGSLIYIAPVVIRDGGRVVETGRIGLRRVNEVPGSTPEDRLWHVEMSDLKPAVGN